MNKTEQETPFSEKTIKFRPHIIYKFFGPFNRPRRRMALISLPPVYMGFVATHSWELKIYINSLSVEKWLHTNVISKAENYKPRFPISSGAFCALASLFTSLQYCLEMLVHYLVTLSYKPVQQSQTHNR